MTRLLDIRLPSSGQFDAIRWLEYCLLFASAVVATVFYQPHGAIVAAMLALVSLLLIPGKPMASTREQQRLNQLNQLQQDGLALRAEWRGVCEEPMSDASSIVRWRIQRDIILWVSACDERLARFPEIGGIFSSRYYKQDLIDELDVSLSTLSRLRRLLSLSESLKLPI